MKNYKFIFWRIINGHWHKIKALENNNYAYCATYERILPVGIMPQKTI